jgi:hypothetical protein
MAVLTAVSGESFEAKFTNTSTGLVRDKYRTPQAIFEACYVFFNP